MLGSIITLLVLLLALFTWGAIAGINAFSRTRDLRRQIGLLQEMVDGLRQQIDGLTHKLNEGRTAATGAATEPAKAPQFRPDTAAKPAARTETPAAAKSDAAGVAGPRPDATRPQPAKTTTPAPPPLPGHAPAAGPPPVPPAPPPPTSGRPASAVPPVPPGSPSRLDFEEILGGKIFVWIGGLALGLGAIFMVHYSIERGLIGPGLRIFLGFMLALALAGAGEYLRRREVQPAIPGFGTAYIPGILTAAAIVAAFATTYSAYALYGFIGPLLAFALLAAVSLAGLAASSIHGPGLAALGLVASYVTPALVSTGKPSAWGLFPYLLFVTAAAFYTAHLRGWLWLAISATAGAVLWGLIWAATSWQAGDATVLLLYVAGLSALAMVLLKDAGADARLLAAEATPAQPPQAAGTAGDGEKTAPRLPPLVAWNAFDWPLIGVMAAIALLAVSVVRMDSYGPASMVLMVALTAVLIAAGWRWPSAVPLAGIAALAFGFLYLTWHLPSVMVPDYKGEFDAALGRVAWVPPGLEQFLMTGVLFAGGIGAASYMALLARRPHAIWAALAALTPIATFAYAYLRTTNFEHSLPFGLAGLALAFLLSFATGHLDGARQGRVIGWSVGALAAATVGALALTATILLQKGWLTIALALMAPGLAWISRQRPIPILRVIAALFAAVVAMRLLYDPVIVGRDLGTTPIVNWLLYGYAIPALAFAAAAWILRQDEDDTAVQVLEGAAIAFLAALLSLQVRHFMNAGEVFAERLTLGELGLHAVIWLGLAIGLHWRYGVARRLVSNWAALATSIVAFAIIGLGLLLVRNPYFTAEPVGTGVLLNDLLLAYAVPALAAAILFGQTRDWRPRLYVNACGALALLLAFAYVTLKVAHAFEGPVLGVARISQAELYAFSAAWITFAIALLAAGITYGSKQLRQAAFLVLVLAIVKVFVVDMADLKGFLRAASLIGLGLTLVGIGYAYQKLVLRGGRGPAAPSAPPPQPPVPDAPPAPAATSPSP